MRRILLCLLLMTFWTVDAAADPAEAVDTYWRGDHEEALREFHELAAKNHTVAQTYLAVMYTLGQGTYVNKGLGRQWRQAAARFRPGDYQRVLDHITKQNRAAVRRPPTSAGTRNSAARLNRLRAQVNAAQPTGPIERGHAYYLGLGVPQDYVEAARWYYSAARQGNPIGQGFLGIMHVWGHGVIEDAVDAYMWLTLATQSAPPGAQTESFRATRRQLNSLLSREGREEGNRKVREFRPEKE